MSALPVPAAKLPRLAGCHIGWARPEGGYALVPRTLLDLARKPLVLPLRNRLRYPLGIERGDAVVIDTARTQPESGRLVACTLNGAPLLRVYHRGGNGHVALRMAAGDIEDQIPVRPTDRLVIHGAVVGVVDCRTGRVDLVWGTAPVVA